MVDHTEHQTTRSSKLTGKISLVYGSTSHSPKKRQLDTSSRIYELTYRDYEKRLEMPAQGWHTNINAVHMKWHYYFPAYQEGNKSRLNVMLPTVLSCTRHLNFILFFFPSVNALSYNATLRYKPFTDLSVTMIEVLARRVHPYLFVTCSNKGDFILSP